MVCIYCASVILGRICHSLGYTYFVILNLIENLLNKLKMDLRVKHEDDAKKFVILGLDPRIQQPNNKK